MNSYKLQLNVKTYSPFLKLNKIDEKRQIYNNNNTKFIK